MNAKLPILLFSPLFFFPRASEAGLRQEIGAGLGYCVKAVGNFIAPELDIERFTWKIDRNESTVRNAIRQLNRREIGFLNKLPQTTPVYFLTYDHLNDDSFPVRKAPGTESYVWRSNPHDLKILETDGVQDFRRPALSITVRNDYARVIFETIDRLRAPLRLEMQLRRAMKEGRDEMKMAAQHLEVRVSKPSADLAFIDPTDGSAIHTSFTDPLRDYGPYLMTCSRKLQIEIHFRVVTPNGYTYVTVFEDGQIKPTKAREAGYAIRDELPVNFH